MPELVRTLGINQPLHMTGKGLENGTGQGLVQDLVQDHSCQVIPRTQGSTTRTNSKETPLLFHFHPGRSEESEIVF